MKGLGLNFFLILISAIQFVTVTASLPFSCNSPCTLQMTSTNMMTCTCNTEVFSYFKGDINYDKTLNPESYAKSSNTTHFEVIYDSTYYGCLNSWQGNTKMSYTGGSTMIKNNGKEQTFVLPTTYSHGSNVQLSFYDEHCKVAIEFVIQPFY